MADISVAHDLFPNKEPVTSATLAQLTSVDVEKIHNLGLREGVQHFLFLNLEDEEEQRVRTLGRPFLIN